MHFDEYPRPNPIAFYWRRISDKARRAIPSIVWPGQEVEVVVTFSEARLDQANLFGGLSVGVIPDLEARLEEIGIEFDAGIGDAGHDWIWDRSLSGPITVKFMGKR